MKTHNINDFNTQYNVLSSEDNCNDIINVAGRLMAKRGHGKATFGNITDQSGTTQYYANINTLGENYNQLLKLDVGDIIGVIGKPFRSKRGELTINMTSYTLLSKSLSPLPESIMGFKIKSLDTVKDMSI